jgi:hypothetical protein
VQLIVFGNASQSTVRLIDIYQDDFNKKLMDFLIENEIPVASSCSGANVCKLCSVNESIVSCQVTVKDFLDKYGNRVTLNYL